MVKTLKDKTEKLIKELKAEYFPSVRLVNLAEEIHSELNLKPHHIICRPNKKNENKGYLVFVLPPKSEYTLLNTKDIEGIIKRFYSQRNYNLEIGKRREVKVPTDYCNEMKKVPVKKIGEIKTIKAKKPRKKYDINISLKISGLCSISVS